MSHWWIGVLGCGLWLTALDAHAAAPSGGPSLPDGKILQWIGELNDPSYPVREAAQRNLVQARGDAVPALIDAARKGPLETSIRAARILARRYDDPNCPSLEAVEDCLETLAESRGSVAEVARVGLETQRPAREKRAIARLEALGATVKFAEDGPGLNLEGGVPTVQQPQIQYVAIGPRWRGGDDAAKYISRLSGRFRASLNGPKGIVYRVVGHPLTPAGIKKLESAGFALEERGAKLGISPDFPPMGDGVLIRIVEPGSAADKAGLLPGDLVIKFGDDVVNKFDDLVDRLKVNKPGEKVVFTIIRGAEEQKVTVELGDW